MEFFLSALCHKPFTLSPEPLHRGSFKKFEPQSRQGRQGKNLRYRVLAAPKNRLRQAAIPQIVVAFFLTGSTGLTRLQHYSFPRSGLGFSSFIRKEEKRIKILQNPVNPVKIKKRSDRINRIDRINKCAGLTIRRMYPKEQATLPEPKAAVFLWPTPGSGKTSRPSSLVW